MIVADIQAWLRTFFVGLALILADQPPSPLYHKAEASSSSSSSSGAQQPPVPVWQSFGPLISGCA